MFTTLPKSLRATGSVSTEELSGERWICTGGVSSTPERLVIGTVGMRSSPSSSLVLRWVCQGIESGSCLGRRFATRRTMNEKTSPYSVCARVRERARSALGMSGMSWDRTTHDERGEDVQAGEIADIWAHKIGDEERSRCDRIDRSRLHDGFRHRSG